MTRNRKKALARELKSLCVLHGTKWKETNPQKSAKIFHELGLLLQDEYLDKTLISSERRFAFIQSATLLNCAFVRDPLEKCRKDLQTLCSELLKAAGASNQEFDILEYSNLLKSEIEEWRMNLKEDAKKITFVPEGNDENTSADLQNCKVKDVETLQTQITERYKSLMVKVSETCISILGEAPCQYALVGMGLMARKEVTPYSDFENMILLQQGVELRDKREYNKINEYFRWYTAIFQVVLINLGETILPSVAIPSLNDFITKDEDWFFDAFSKRGICIENLMPDSCKKLHGRQQVPENKLWETELIKPVKEMVEFLEHVKTLKNGYYLADIFTDTCYVAGSECLYKTFEVCVKNQLTDAEQNLKQEIIHAIQKEIDVYRRQLNLLTTIEPASNTIKQFVYRSTSLFVTGLARMHNMNKSTCFEMVRSMAEHNLVTAEFACKLQYALALSYEIKLKICLDRNKQFDEVDFSLDQKENFASSVTDDLTGFTASLFEAVGRQSCYDFFEIVVCLQTDISDHIDVEGSCEYFDPMTVCIAISSILRLYDRLIVAGMCEERAFPTLGDKSPVDAQRNGSNDSKVSADPENKGSNSYKSAGNDVEVSADDVTKCDSSGAISFLKAVGQIPAFSSIAASKQDTVAYNDDDKANNDTNRSSFSIDNNRDFMQNDLNQDIDAEGLEVDDDDNDAKHVVQDVISSDCKVSVNGKEGITTLPTDSHVTNVEPPLKNCAKSNSSDGKSTIRTSTVKSNCNFTKIGKESSATLCDAATKDSNKNDESFNNHAGESNAIDACDNDDKGDDEIIGYCHLLMQKFNQKLTRFNISSRCPRRGEKITSVNGQSVAEFIFGFGSYFFSHSTYIKASYCFKAALNWHSEVCDDAKPMNKAKYLCWLGRSLSEDGKYGIALENLKNSLKIYQTLTDDEKVGEYFETECLMNIAVCQQEMHQLEDSCASFTKSLQVGSTSLPGGKKLPIEPVYLLKLGICLYDLRRYIQAKSKFKEYLILCIESDITVARKRSRAIGEFHLGRCLKNLGCSDESRIFLQAAVKNFRELIEDESVGENLDYKARCFQLIGKSFVNLDQFEEAIENFSESVQLWKALYQKSDSCEAYCFLMSSSYIRIARCYWELELPEKAIQQLNQFQPYFKTLTVVYFSKPSMLDLCKELGKLYQEFGDYANALSFFRNAINEVDPETSPYIIASLNNRCSLCLDQLLEDCDNDNDQIRYLETALEIYLRLLQDDRRNSKLLKEIGFCYFQSKNYSKAVSYLKKYVMFANAPDRLHSPYDKVAVANALKKIALCMVHERKWNESLRYFKLSAKKFESLPKSSKNDFEIATLYNDIAERLQFAEDLEGAERWFEKAIKVFESIPQTPKVGRHLALSLKNLGDFYEKKLRSKSQALVCYQRARDAFLELPDPRLNNYDLAFLTEKIGNCQKFLGDLENAIDAFSESLTLFEQFGRHGLKRAYIFKHIGLCYQKLNDHEESVDYFLESNSTFERLPFFSENHFAEMGMNLKLAGNSYHARMMYCEAKSHYRQALDWYDRLSDLRTYENDLSFIRNRLHSRLYQNL